jgi:hypothetical protein
MSKRASFKNPPADSDSKAKLAGASLANIAELAKAAKATLVKKHLLLNKAKQS